MLHGLRVWKNGSFTLLNDIWLECKRGDYSDDNERIWQGCEGIIGYSTWRNVSETVSLRRCRYLWHLTWDKLDELHVYICTLLKSLYLMAKYRCSYLKELFSHAVNQGSLLSKQQRFVYISQKKSRWWINHLIYRLKMSLRSLWSLHAQNTLELLS